MTSVSAIIVTRGDVLLQPILKSLPPEWEVVIWNNGLGRAAVPPKGSLNVYDDKWMHRISDVSVYGRYAAIKYASNDLIYVQDDDVIVSDPQAIVGRWEEGGNWPCKGCNGQRSALCSDCEAAAREQTDHLVANMPQEFRHAGYTDSCLVGFGACFHRDAPERAFDRFMEFHDHMIPLNIRQDVFWRTCDVVFTTLTPRVLVDVPKENLPYATDSNRMYRQPDHVGERARMLELARKVRDS